MGLVLLDLGNGERGSVELEAGSRSRNIARQGIFTKLHLQLARAGLQRSAGELLKDEKGCRDKQGLVSFAFQLTRHMTHSGSL